MAEDQLVRMSKVLKELGVGFGTVKEFLEGKGFEDINPNSRLDIRAYNLLLDEFQADRQVKQEAEKTAEVLQQRKEERMAAAPVVEKPAAPLPPEPEPSPEPETPSTGPKVLGTMDLASVDPKERKKQQAAKEKKEKEEAERKAMADKLAKAAKEDENIARLAEDARKAAEVELKKKAEKEAEKAAEPEVIRAVATKLAGTTVLGKMELPVEKERKPVASSAGAADNKRKRKRVRVDEGTAAKGAGAGAARGKREVKPALTEEEIQKQVKETLARLTGGSGKSKASKHRRDKRAMVQERMMEEAEMQEREKSTLKVTEFVTANELAT